MANYAQCVRSIGIEVGDGVYDFVSDEVAGLNHQPSQCKFFSYLPVGKFWKGFGSDNTVSSSCVLIND